MPGVLRELDDRSEGIVDTLCWLNTGPGNASAGHCTEPERGQTFVSCFCWKAVAGTSVFKAKNVRGLELCLLRRFSGLQSTPLGGVLHAHAPLTLPRSLPRSLEHLSIRSEGPSLDHQRAPSWRFTGVYRATEDSEPESEGKWPGGVQRDSGYIGARTPLSHAPIEWEGPSC